MSEQSFEKLTVLKSYEILSSGEEGLTQNEASARLSSQGANELPAKPPTSPFVIFLHQFLSPLIYILLAAAVISLSLGDTTDAIFIGVILLINALLGTFQEFGAERSAHALKHTGLLHTVVKRDGELSDISARDLVTGDIVFLESGRKVPADLRLTRSTALEIDESLLTGESEPVLKDHSFLIENDVVIGDRKNMAFAGSLVIKGRGHGVVVATAFKTELGKIANVLVDGESAKPPLLIRLEDFTKKIALVLLLLSAAIAVLLFLRGESLSEILILTVALAVSAIPEGLPVAITVALSVASKRMARQNVIVRNLPAVEALGSCTFIATDKTGTLTINELTAEDTWIHDSSSLEELILSAVLCNEGEIRKKNEKVETLGDAVDVALLKFAEKKKQSVALLRKTYQHKESIPFESQNQYAASLHENAGEYVISIKGAFEKVIQMCDEADREHINEQVDTWASKGYRVLAFAGLKTKRLPKLDPLPKLNFYGLVFMIDPLRPEAKGAIEDCKRAGIDIAMITGDHSKTALAIARELGFANDLSDVVTGIELKEMQDDHLKIEKILATHVFARVEPEQKLEIVKVLLDAGKFVAVTGDGANDAPALKMANVGVAMGLSGTDVAKETADLILTDDRFASIVAGIIEGRIAYANIRKVIYLLISTGAAEILMFLLSIIFNIPIPLTAVQILWLNLITNGIQDIGLAFEPAEGDELSRKPRKVQERIFDRLMLERIILSGAVMGGVSFFYFYHLIEDGQDLFYARNLTLLLMVLFENVMIGNCRSETKSFFKTKFFSNPILLWGTLISQLVHIGSMYSPFMQNVLGLETVSFSDWFTLLIFALSILLVIEIHKKIRS
jgi:P-type Ca2+ transporter type 2C